MEWKKVLRWSFGAILLGLVLPAAAQSPNFTRDNATARLYGVHEIVLSGNSAVENPFDTQATITFTAPSGQPVTVDLFYDGEDVWRGRVYINAVGGWRWQTASSDDPLLDRRHGAFEAVESDLRGMLRPHPDNPQQWATENGQWFLNLSDTAYKLFNAGEPLWQEYIHDDVALGVTSVRAGALGGWEWLPEDEGEFGASNYPWAGDDHTRYDLDKFQTTDTRLQWLLDTYPDLYIQMILFGQIHFNSDEVGQRWLELPQAVRTNTLRYMIARWAAYPQLFWLTVNDLGCDATFPNNRAYTQEIGRYFAEHDPWQHLLSVSPARDQRFCFDEEEADWVSYIHLEGSHELDALWADDYNERPLHVFLGEDYYEQDSPDYHPRNPAYFQRWLYWSWLLAGGSANYGGRYWVLHPYSQTDTLAFEHRDMEWGPLSGLDSLIYIRRFIEERGLDLTRFSPDKQLVRDIRGENDIRRPQAAVRGDLEEIIIYHPNADSARARAAVHTDTAAYLTIDLSSAFNRFDVEWYRAEDGLAQAGERLAGGAVRDLTAPWVGYDVVLHLTRQETLPATPIPQGTPTPPPSPEPVTPPSGSTIIARYTFDEGEGSIIHDSSSYGRPLDLEIADTEAVEWSDDFLTVRQPTYIASHTGANKIAVAVGSSNALTVEVWVRPVNLIQNGPARIITYSPNIRMRNFTLGQGVGDELPSNRYTMRLRTTETDANGLPGLQTRSLANTELTHIVYTRDTRGVVRLYVNGIFAAEDALSGDLSNWESDWPLVLANEPDEERPWLGEYHFVAIYNYALDEATISERFEAGPEAES